MTLLRTRDPKAFAKTIVEHGIEHLSNTETWLMQWNPEFKRQVYDAMPRDLRKFWSDADDISSCPGLDDNRHRAAEGPDCGISRLVENASGNENPYELSRSTSLPLVA